MDIPKQPSPAPQEPQDPGGAPLINDQSDDELDLLADHYARTALGGSEPRTVKEALQRMDCHLWQEALDAEIKQHLANGTWEVVKLPPGAKAIGSGWVFKIKRNADGSVERYKARLVAKGYAQLPGRDYFEVFAPTFRPASLRLVLALAAIRGFHMRSVDISSAFTNGDLEETIYMHQPEGYVELGKDYVCKLVKSLYGLKQAARCWNKKLHDAFVSMGFGRIESDRSVYVYTSGDIKVIVPVFIDDITFVGADDDSLVSSITSLSQSFKLRDLGPTFFLLGMEITRDWSHSTISLCQRQYIIDILQRFGMADCTPVTTPLTPDQGLETCLWT